MLIVIYKGKVRKTWRTTSFILVNISVCRYFLKLKAPEFAYINAPTDHYKGTQKQ